MININELKIGNYVNLITLDQAIQITSLAKTDLSGLYTWDEDGSEYEDSLSGIEGIPLTPEILQKCGFEKTETQSYKLAHKIVTITLFPLQGSIFWVALSSPFGMVNSKRIDHLHQLQKSLPTDKTAVG